MSTERRLTRWAEAGEANAGYARKFAELVEAGEDVDGEARLADTLAPRNGRILDAGSGMGRVAAALSRCGHQVVAVEPDSELLAQSRRTYRDLLVASRFVESDILGLSTEMLTTLGASTEFDVVVCVGNVMIFLAEDTEVAVLTHLRHLLAADGRLLVGFHLKDGPSTSRSYSPEEFVADATAAGLRVDLRAGSYNLHPADDGYGVWVLSRADAPAVTTSVGHPTPL